MIKAQSHLHLHIALLCKLIVEAQLRVILALLIAHLSSAHYKYLAFVDEIHEHVCFVMQTLMDQAAWNLCPVSGVASGTSCYYADDQTFTDLSGTTTVVIDDCPDGVLSHLPCLALVLPVLVLLYCILPDVALPLSSVHSLVPIVLMIVCWGDLARRVLDWLDDVKGSQRAACWPNIVGIWFKPYPNTLALFLSDRQLGFGGEEGLLQQGGWWRASAGKAGCPL